MITIYYKEEAVATVATEAEGMAWLKAHNLDWLFKFTTSWVAVDSNY